MSALTVTPQVNGSSHRRSARAHLVVVGTQPRPATQPASHANRPALPEGAHPLATRLTVVQPVAAVRRPTHITAMRAPAARSSAAGAANTQPQPRVAAAAVAPLQPLAASLRAFLVVLLLVAGFGLGMLVPTAVAAVTTAADASAQAPVTSTQISVEQGSVQQLSADFHLGHKA